MKNPFKTALKTTIKVVVAKLLITVAVISAAFLIITIAHLLIK